MKKKNLAILLSIFLVACGGGQNQVNKNQNGLITNVQEKLILQSSDLTPISETWQTITMLTTRSILTVQESINQQIANPGRLMLWAGFTKGEGFGNFKDYVDLAAQTNRFEYAYIYDELFWENINNTAQTAIGYNEDAVLEAAKYAQSKNLKPAIVILPNVILDEKFALKEINTYDTIGIDVYPSILVTKDTGTCKYNDNVLTNLLYCSQKKLRDLGFTGKIWYVYQAFGIKGEDNKVFIDNLNLQKETIADSANFIDGIAPFGLYLGNDELIKEPYLIPGKNSDFENLVNFK